MRNYKTNGLLSFETISRQRRLVQEACPELRGEEYEKRHRKQEEVKQDLKEIKTNAFFADDSKPNEDLLSGQMHLFGQTHG
jgi:hydroxylamine reductase (hybrid-cluster protein)